MCTCCCRCAVSGYRFQQATLNDIQNASYQGKLTELQAQRWEEFQQFLRIVYSSEDDAMYVAGMLRRSRRSKLRGSPQELDAVTKADLLAYTDLEYNGKDRDCRERLMEDIASEAVATCQPFCA